MEWGTSDTSVPARKKEDKKDSPSTSSPRDTPREDDSPGSGAATPVPAHPETKHKDSNVDKLPQAVSADEDKLAENTGESGGAAPLRIDIPGQREKEK